MLWSLEAFAAPIVWTAPPPADQRALIEQVPNAGAEVTLVSLQDQLSAPVDPQAAIGKVDSTLESVRAYETRLDGEKIIMDDLQAAVDKVDVLRDTDDRDALFTALAYQGFAVHRFFGEALEGEAAAAWSADLDGTRVPTPWLNAVAIAPDRAITAYDIAEAPQRVAFTKASEAVKAALPGGLRIEHDDGKVFVDGSPVADTDATLRIPPGRHYAHLVVDGNIVAYQVVDLASGGSESVTLRRASPDVPLSGLQPGAAVPDALVPLIEAAGGELWIARPGDKGPALLAATPTGVRAIELAKPGSDDESDSDGVYVAAGLGAGWLSSGDFYKQAPADELHNKATVNSAAVEGGVGVGLAMGLLRAEAGVDVLYTPGANHTALSGDGGGYRARPVPTVAVGLPWVQAIGGFMFPYHGMVGARGTLPLPKGLEARANFRVGLPGKLSYDDGTEYRTLPVYALTAGITYRLGPGARSSLF